MYTSRRRGVAHGRAKHAGCARRLHATTSPSASARSGARSMLFADPHLDEPASWRMIQKHGPQWYVDVECSTQTYMVRVARRATKTKAEKKFHATPRARSTGHKSREWRWCRDVLWELRKETTTKRRRKSKWQGRGAGGCVISLHTDHAATTTPKPNVAWPCFRLPGVDSSGGEGTATAVDTDGGKGEAPAGAWSLCTPTTPQPPPRSLMWLGRASDCRVDINYLHIDQVSVF